MVIFSSSTTRAGERGGAFEVDVVGGALGGEAAVADGQVASFAEVLRLLDHWWRTGSPGRGWWR